MDAARVKAYDQPTPPEDLTSQDRLEIAYLTELGNEELDRRVAEWISLTTVDGDQSGQRVYFSAELVARTFGALGRLIQESERKQRLQRNRQATGQADEYYLKLVRARDRARRVRASVSAAKAERSPRQAAYRVLGELFRPEMREIMARLKAGDEPRAVLAEMRARKAS